MKDVCDTSRTLDTVANAVESIADVAAWVAKHIVGYGLVLPLTLILLPLIIKEGRRQPFGIRRARRGETDD